MPFLLQALVYLGAAVISVPIAKRLGLGSVLGYLIAGVVIGPFALSLVGEQTDVMKFAEFGVVILLFLIGLEVQPSTLWDMRKAIFGFGGAQVVGTSVAIAGVSMLQVVRIPSPGRIVDEDGEVIPASHMNFLIANEAVIVPIYAEESGAFAVEVIRGLFPEREVIGLPSTAILTGGGSFHCISQQEPGE